MKDLNDILPSRIIKMACDFEGITEDELIIKSNKPKYVMTRKYITYCLMYHNFTYQMIGKLILKDRSLVVYYKNSFLNSKDILTQEKLRDFKGYMGQQNVIIPGLVKWKKQVSKRPKKVKFN